MKQKTIALGVGAILAGGVLWATVRHGKPNPKIAPQAEATRQKVELTVYKEDFGMVREVRPLPLEAGSNRLRVTEVSRQLDPQSVLMRWQGEGANLPELVAHAYDLGVGDGTGLLKRYQGQEAELIRYGESGREGERQQGKIIVGENGGLIFQTEGRYLVNPQGTIAVPTNAEVVPIPQLTVQAESQTAQELPLEVAYLTRGLAWSADYVATLATDRDAMTLEAWATVTNRTGADYPNATVTLIAGTPNRAVQPERAKMPSDSMSEGRFVTKPRFNFPVGGRAAIAPPEIAGELYAYPIKNATTVVQERMNRLKMLASENVQVVKDYNTRLPDLNAYDGYGWGLPNRPARHKVALAVSFANREKDGLGQPLPSGAIRFYEPDATGVLRYVGASSLSDTPKDDKVYATLTTTFDVYVESRLVKTQRIDKRTLRKEVELTLRNQKKAPVTVRVVQGIGGVWKMVAESAKRTNLDAYTIQWKANVPAGGATNLRYTVDLKE